MKPAFVVFAAFFVVTACASSSFAADDQLAPDQRFQRFQADGFVFCPESARDQPVPLYVGFCKKRQIGTLNCGEKVEVLNRQDDMLRISTGETGPRGQRRTNLVAASAISRQPDKFVPFDDRSGVPTRSPDCSQFLARENAPEGFVFCSSGKDSAPVYFSACQSHAAGSLACGENVRVLSRSGDLLEVTSPPNGMRRYIDASAVSQQADKFVPFDDASGVQDQGAADCATQPERNVTPPHVTFMPDPEYSDLARKKKIQGVILLSLTVGTDGTTHDITVEKGIGYGLDEKAVEAVRRWKFTPALKDGQPIERQIKAEVNFRLY